ncbi:TPA: hypothetical protein N0F65_004677 [Lagenidium giganteum]|uniref:Retroviral polymerase SH3-like domain-containing protein n=1 Tax=Lagenidium giganteum TaxID=4803 RepID=A0AAV2Z269_9STRA|nr:TPA: hypothetical protein N0F65_004677 [Lagenidium giganteum]
MRFITAEPARTPHPEAVCATCTIRILLVLNKARAKTCILLGYSNSTKCYKLLEVGEGTVIRARGENVKFYEHFTVARQYGQLVLERKFDGSIGGLPSTVPVVRIQTSVESFVDGLPDPSMGGIAIADEVHSSCEQVANSSPSVRAPCSVSPISPAPTMLERFQACASHDGTNA